MFTLTLQTLIDDCDAMLDEIESIIDETACDLFSNKWEKANDLWDRTFNVFERMCDDQAIDQEFAAEKYLVGLAADNSLAAAQLAESGLEKWESGTGQNLYVHAESKCKGTACPIHNPTDHCMRDYPLHWRHDLGIMERICPCGVGHPDPDEMKLLTTPSLAVHGCCGCCAK